MPQLTVYKASAGSGKTFTLATEYIKLLIDNPQQYRNILAVTFTNKATEEMKLRILSQLYGIWKQLPSSESYIRKVTEELNVSREHASARAHVALSNLLHNYNYFRVETIDTFFQSVLRNLARELELTANLRIELNDEQVKDEAVDRLIEGLEKTDDRLRWVISFIEQNIEEDRGWNVMWQLKKFGRTIFKDFYKSESKSMNALLGQKDFIKHYADDLKKLKLAAQDQMQQCARTFFETLEDNQLEIDDLSNGKSGVAGYFIKLMTDDFSDGNCLGKRVVSAMSDAECWVKKTHKQRAFIISLVEESLLPLLQRAESQRPKLWRLFASADVTLAHLNEIRMLSSIETKVRALNDEANRFLLSDTQQLLHDLIDGSDSPFIFEKIGTQLEHVMIDEFQDTSTVQWANFKVLLEETMSHEHPSNLIVGDVKQSIYRWRSGDWRLLNDIGSQFENAAQRLQIETLQTNYRSCRNIVEFNNAFFSRAAEIEYADILEENPAGAEQLKAAYQDVIQQVPAGKPAEGLVRITLLPGKEAEADTLEMIADTVDELMSHGIQPREMAVLVRKNDYIPLIADYFQQHRPQVKIVSDEAFKLDASLAVTTLVNALRLLSSPEEPLLRENVVAAYSHIMGSAGAEDAPALPLLDESVRRELLRLPLRELIERLYTLLGIRQIADEGSYLCAFYDQVNSFVQDNGSSIEAFIEDWDNRLHSKNIQGDDVDGIRIISIHKSKGLEFDHVIIPFADWKLELGGTLWCKPSAEPFNRLPIVPVNYSAKLLDTIYRQDYLDEHLQNCVDNLNLLYVGLTRACKNLFVIGVRNGQKGRRCALIQQALSTLRLPGSAYMEGEDDAPTVFEYGTLCSQRRSAAHAETANVFLKEVLPHPVRVETFHTPVDFRQSNRSRDFVADTHSAADEQQRYIKMGNVMHSLFSSIRTEDDIPQVLRQLEFDGILYDDDVSAENIRQMLAKRLADPRVKDWFSHRWTLFNECSIIAIDDNGELRERRPDRVMTDGRQMIVVDFKFGKPRAEYQEQVLEYVNLLRGMGYPQVRGYLWYVYSNQIVEVAA